MSLSSHLKYTAAASTIMLAFCNLQQILCFATGSILIDADHYIFYAVKCKKFDIKGMFAYYDMLTREKDKITYLGVFLFHTVEFFIVVGILSLYMPLMFYLLYGMIFHYVLDTIYLYRIRCVSLRAFSLIQGFIYYIR